MPRRVTFYSDGIELIGYVYEPTDPGPGERRAAVLVCHRLRRQPGSGAARTRPTP